MCKWILSPGKLMKKFFLLLRYLKLLFVMEKKHCHSFSPISSNIFGNVNSIETNSFGEKMSKYTCKSMTLFNVLPRENLIMWLHINYNIGAVAVRCTYHGVAIMTSGTKQIILDVTYFKEKSKRVKKDCHTWKVLSAKCKVFYLWN